MVFRRSMFVTQLKRTETFNDRSQQKSVPGRTKRQGRNLDESNRDLTRTLKSYGREKKTADFPRKGVQRSRSFHPGHVEDVATGTSCRAHLYRCSY